MKRLTTAFAILVLVLGVTPSAQAVLITYATTLSGANETPPNASPATGSGQVIINTVANSMRVVFDFSGLLGTSTVAHIHCCTTAPGTGTAGVATPVPLFPGFPVGVNAGSYDQTFLLSLASSFNPAFVTASGSVDAAAVRLLDGLDRGLAYLNVHSTQFPAGEINGFLVRAQAVPEPGLWALLAAGLVGVGLARRKGARPAVPRLVTERE